MHAHENSPPALGAPALPVEERPPDSATILARLRTAYPLWGFVDGPRTRWTAVCGPVTIQRADPVALRLAVKETMRGQQ